MLMFMSMHLGIWEVNFTWNRMACIFMGSLVLIQGKKIIEYCQAALNYGVPCVYFMQEK